MINNSRTTIVYQLLFLSILIFILDRIANIGDRLQCISNDAFYSLLFLTLLNYKYDF